MSAAEVVPETRTVTLKSGRKLVFHELSMLDLRDLERFKRNEKVAEDSLDLVAYYVWLMARKEGVPREKQLAGKWAMTFEDLLIDLAPGDLKELAAVIRPFSASDAETSPESSTPASSGSG